MTTGDARPRERRRRALQFGRRRQVGRELLSLEAGMRGGRRDRDDVEGRHRRSRERFRPSHSPCRRCVRRRGLRDARATEDGIVARERARAALALSLAEGSKAINRYALGRPRREPSIVHARHGLEVDRVTRRRDGRTARRGEGRRRVEDAAAGLCGQRPRRAKRVRVRQRVLPGVRMSVSCMYVVGMDMMRFSPDGRSRARGGTRMVRIRQVEVDVVQFVAFSPPSDLGRRRTHILGRRSQGLRRATAGHMGRRLVDRTRHVGAHVGA